MAASAGKEPTLQDVVDRLDKLTAKLDDVKRNQDQGQRWQDRTWDVVKWVGGISAGLAISASIALVGPVLRQLGQ